jgi:hypothetical protein
LEGLEITVLSYKEAIATDPTERLDASFFEKRFIEIRQRASAWDRLDAHAKSVVCGPFGSNLLNENYVEHGIPMVRPFNLRDGRTDRGEIALLEESFVKHAGLKVFARGAVLFARVGEIGAGVNLSDQVTISPNIIAAELRESIDPYFVGVFANTKYGRVQLEAGTKAVAQPTISTESIRALRVPPLGTAVQQKIAEIFKRSAHADDDGNQFFSKAETTLLEKLGLKNWQPPASLSYVRDSSDAFRAGRLDAEFFAPRVRELLERLGRDGLTVNDVAPPRRERFAPAAQGDFHYIEIGGIGADGTARSDVVPQSEAPSRATQRVRAGDIITSTVRPIRRLSAIIGAEQDGHVCSSGFVVLQARAIRPDALLTYLRLPPVCALMDLHTSASLYPAISEADLLALPIPKIPDAVQQEIESLAEAGRQAKRRSTQLLEAAKRAVEIAIEQDEATAMAYLACVDEDKD